MAYKEPMTRLRLVRDLRHRLAELGPKERALDEVVPALCRLLGAERACAFVLGHQGARRTLEFFHGVGFDEGLAGEFAAFVSAAPAGFAPYDPAPEPGQRNVAMRKKEILACHQGKVFPIQRTFLPRHGLDTSDQLRVLVCEGDRLLAWVGALREGSFSVEDLRVLAALVPTLRRRLTEEGRLRETSVQGADVAAALETVPAPAFIVSGNAAVLHANAAGRSLLETRDTETREALAQAVGGQDLAAVRLARLSPTTFLAILPYLHDPAPLVAGARARWSLTPRQADVLRLVGQGLSNRAVGRALGCAESTVELHVTALLHKAQCESRSALVAKLWSGGL